ncbi:MAG: nucleotidyl transferase AbiEii/AbiGii toxin family protein [Oscillospiraceae bacterium]|jgi:predicted nucleotidyltransferase component of viral defense system|nr:nucleotidyl transferase AbiEii/AbiGii toxin family protein [Oscillospiraceae bacterium]
MTLHLDRTGFSELLIDIGERSDIDVDILEKDYYVCVVLKQLSQRQDRLRAYFKGGTAIYKMLAEMRRFSEDIDLTVRSDESLSNTKNKAIFEESAKGYAVDGLSLVSDRTINRKGTVTAFYEYQTVAEYIVNPLRRTGEIQVEATSFTESEPTENYKIEPLMFKLATPQQRQYMQVNYGIEPFDVLTITLERAFIDKLFAAQKYLTDLPIPELSRPIELAKHLYDIVVLFKEQRIKDFLINKAEVNRIEAIRRHEEKARIGGVSADVLLVDFAYFKATLDKECYVAFAAMQDKYVLQDRFRVSAKELDTVLSGIYKFLKGK